MMEIEGPRGLGTGELPELLAVSDLIFRGTAPQLSEIGTEYRQFFELNDPSHFRVMRHGGEIVASACFQDRILCTHGRQLKAGLLGMVGALPLFRGRGLAAVLMQDCARVMREEGCRLSILWAWPDIQGLYRKLGYELVNHGAPVFVIPKSALPCIAVTSHYAMVEFRESHLGDLIRLHEKECLRVERCKAYYERAVLGKQGRLEKRPFEVLLARREGAIVAYLVPCASEWGSEFGGEPDAIKYLIQQCLASQRPGPMRIACPATHPLARELGPISERREAEGEMILLLDPARVVSDFSDGALALEADGDGFALVYEDARVQVPDRPALTRLLFGPDRPGEVLHDLDIANKASRALAGAFPIAHYIWGLDHC